jgi:hypothetical protein
MALSLLLGGVSAAPAALPTTITHDPIVAAIISQITTSTLEHELAGLTGEQPVTAAGSLYTITTRNTFQTEPISMATRYAHEQLASTGLDVTYHHYQYAGRQLCNVVAEKPGVVDPDEIYLITAHLDDMPEGSLAPGADDNGSGSVAVLMAARLLAKRHFAYTIRFVLFTGEEQGLHGSAAYAADCASLGEDIQGVVNLDMIAYNSDSAPIIDLHDYADVPQSLELTELFSDVIGVYGLDLIPHRFTDSWAISRSDQWSFLQEGYPAFLAIEDWSDHTPYYHQTGDRISTLNLDYYADYTRAGIATIAHLGRLLRVGYLSGTVSALDSGQPLSGATVAAPAPAYGCTITAPTDSSGVYSLPLPTSVYTLTAWPALPGYYPATVTDVLITTDTITLQDLALEPWPRWYFPLVAYEP